MASKSELSKKYYGKSYSSLNSRQKQQVDRDVGRNTTPVRKRSSSPSSAPTEQEKKTIVVGVETTPSGLISRQVNIGKNLSSQERRAISDAVSRQAKARQEEVFVVGVQDPTLQQSREITQSFPSVNQSQEANLNLAPATEFVTSRNNPGVISSRVGGQRTSQIVYELPNPEQTSTSQQPSSVLIPGSERRRKGGEFIEQLVAFSADQYSAAKESFARGDPFGGTISLARSVTPAPLLIGAGTSLLVDIAGSSVFSAVTNPQARAAAGSAISSFLVNNPGRTTLAAGRQVANSLGEEFLRSPPLFVADLFIPLPPASTVTKPVSSAARKTFSTTRRTLSDVFAPATSSRTTAKNVGLAIEDVVGSYPIRDVGGEIVERQRTLTGEINPNSRFNERLGLPEELIFEPSGRPSSAVERRQFTENLLDSSKQKQSTLVPDNNRLLLEVDDVSEFLDNQKANRQVLEIDVPEKETQTKLVISDNDLFILRPETAKRTIRTELTLDVQPSRDTGFKLFGGSKRGSANIDPGQFLSNVKDLFRSSDSVLDDFSGGSRSSRLRRQLSFSADDLANPLSRSSELRLPTSRVVNGSLSFIPSLGLSGRLAKNELSLSSSNALLSDTLSRSALVSRLDSALLSDTVTVNDLDTAQKVFLDSDTALLSDTVTDTTTRSRLVTDSLFKSLDTVTKPVSRPRTDLTLRNRPKKPRTPRLKLDLDFNVDSTPSSSKNYRFVVGRQGNKNYSTFSSPSLSKGTNRAKNIVGKSLSASFSVTKGGKPISSKERTRIKNSLGKEFRPAKSMKNSFVEKRKYRLNSPEEKKSIKRAKSQRLTGSASLFNSALRDVNNGISLRRSRRRLF